MAKIAINLLPPEFMAEKLKVIKFYKVQAIGVGIILVMIFLTSIIIALRIIQSRTTSLVAGRLAEAEEKATQLKSTQASLVLLKDRLKVIDQFLGIPSKQTSIYKLIDELIPSSVAVNVISIEKSGELTLLASVSDYQTLDRLINDLTNKETTQGRIKEVSIDSLNRTKESFYRISLKIIPN